MPKNYEEAMNYENAPTNGKDAIKQRVTKNLYGNHVMKIVENKSIPRGIKPLDVKWVFTIKDNGIYKARLAVRGFRQIKGVDYTYIYPPIIEMDNF